MGQKILPNGRVIVVWINLAVMIARVHRLLCNPLCLQWGRLLVINIQRTTLGPFVLTMRKAVLVRDCPTTTNSSLYEQQICRLCIKAKTIRLKFR
ncbi:unnamed protein product [Rhizophagus irregularis]|nr:unnamed protein product [Rhizophagus irregularis]